MDEINNSISRGAAKTEVGEIKKVMASVSLLAVLGAARVKIVKGQMRRDGDGERKSEQLGLEREKGVQAGKKKEAWKFDYGSGGRPEELARLGFVLSPLILFLSLSL